MPVAREVVFKPGTSPPEKSEVSTPESTVGFTQLLRALNYDQVKPEPARRTEPPAEVMSSPQAAAETPVESPRRSSAEAGQASSSFTQLFENPAPELAGKEATEAPIVPAQAAPSQPAIPLAVDPSSFTQILQALNVSTTVAAPAQIPLNPPAEPGSFTQMFQMLDRPADQSPPMAPLPMEKSPAPGPPTAMFSTDPAASEGAKVDPPPTFSQMLRSRDAPLTAPAPPTASVTPPAISFTQMFRSLDEKPTPPSPAPSAKPEPGSFTQMFSPPSSSPGKSPAVMPRTDLPTAQPQDDSFTQLFGKLSNLRDQAWPGQQQNPAQTFGDPGGSGSPFAAAADAGYASPPAHYPQAPPAPAAGGGLTQLLRTLDQSPRPAPEAFQPASSQQGAFTSTYGALDESAKPQPQAPAAPQVFAQPAASYAASQDATKAFHVPASPIPQAAPPISAGPSEFTRILNASAFRENALRGGGESAAPASAPAPSGGPGMSFAAPRMPSVSVSPLAMPSGGGAPGAPHVSVQGLHLPSAPHISPVKLDIPEPSAPPAGKMQQLLPLLLIMIIFLLVALLIAVFFLMKR